MIQPTAPSPRRTGPLLLMGGGLLLLACAVLACAGIALFYWLPRSVVSHPAATAAAQPVEQSYPEIPRTALAEAKAAFDSKTAIFVDVRDANSYAASHVPGALSIPLPEFERRLGELDRSDWIIPYCT